MLQTTEESQADLMRRIALKDKDALGAFYDLTATPLYSVAFRILGNTQEAEEVVQDVFMNIWTKAATYDESKGKAFHWAMSITRNRCIDRIRARQRRAQVIVNLDEEIDWTQVLDLAPAGRPPESDDLALVHNAVNDLPAEQREAIELAFFLGYSHQEIAGFLNEPLGTVKARIRRGMMKLREVLEKYL